MGKVLQVRVYAYTFSENDVREVWPRLWTLAFEDNTPGFPHDMKGVHELVRALDDLYQFGNVGEHLRDFLSGRLPALKEAVADLGQSLADWNPKRANELTDAIEDVLTEMNTNLPKP